MASNFTEKMVQKNIFQKSFTILEKNEQGTYVLKHGKIQTIVGIICILLGLGLSVIPFLPGQKVASQLDFILLMAFFGLIVIFGIYWTANARNYKVEFDEVKVSIKNAFGKVTEINWNEVTSIDFSNFNKALYLKSLNGKIKVLIALQGFYTIMWMISEKFAEEVYKNALINVHQFYMKNGVRI